MNLSEEEKTKLVNDHKKIIYYMANRFRFYEEDVDEILGWCYLGIAVAISKYESDPTVEFSELVFKEIRRVVYAEYNKASNKRSISSLDEPIYGDEELTLGLLLGVEEYHYGEQDIEQMVIDATILEKEIDRDIIYSYFIDDKSVNELAEKYNLRLPYIKRVTNRGIDLLRTYLFNNDIISEFLLYPEQKEYTIQRHPVVKNEVYGKIKYLNRTYPFLSTRCIASIMGIDTYNVSVIVDYPNVSYIKALPDDELDRKAQTYIKEHYPYMLPSQVEVIKKASIK